MSNKNKNLKKLHIDSKVFKSKAWVVPLAFAFLLFGFMVTVQYNTQQNLSNSLEEQQTDALVTMVQSLSDRRSRLENELNTLDKASQDASITESLEYRLEQLQIFNGSKDVVGPGVSVVITGDSPFLGLDILDIINELWVSGAEAISVNDIRIVASTSIIDTTDENDLPVITVNGQKILTPVIIKAIGDPDTLEKGLTFTGGIIDNLAALYNVHPTVKQEENLSVLASQNNETIQYKKKKDPNSTESTTIKDVLNNVMPAQQQ